MSYRFSAALALGAALCLGATSANASSVDTYAMLSDFSLAVIDLAPDDGVAASYSLLTSEARAEVAAGTNWRNFDTDIDSNNGPGWIPTLRLDSQGGDHSRASTGTWGDLQSSVHVTAEGTNSAYRHASAEQVATFTLSPHTRITVNGWASLGYSVDWNPANPNDGYASVQLDLYSSSFGSSSFYVPLYSEPGFGGVEEEVAFSMDNNTDQVAQVYLRAFTRVEGSVQPTSPVPEPATYAMLAAGALLVAGAARRRSPLSSRREGTHGR